MGQDRELLREPAPEMVKHPVRPLCENQESVPRRRLYVAEHGDDESMRNILVKKVIPRRPHLRLLDPQRFRQHALCGEAPHSVPLPAGRALPTTVPLGNLLVRVLPAHHGLSLRPAMRTTGGYFFATGYNAPGTEPVKAAVDARAVRHG